MAEGNGSYLRVKNWDKFQHYKDRSPPWIKLYRDLLHDYTFRKLPDRSKLDLVLLWLLAANHQGLVPTDRQYLKSVLGLNRIPNTQILIDQGFLLETASNMLPQRREENIREEERAETSTAFLDNSTSKPTGKAHAIAMQAALKAKAH